MNVYKHGVWLSSGIELLLKWAFFVLFAIILSSCSKIPENNDPILGTWVKVSERFNEEGDIDRVREEWIFNDVFLGRFQCYLNSELVRFSDFQWSKDKQGYTLVHGDPAMANVVVGLRQNGDDGADELVFLDGTLAFRK